MKTACSGLVLTLLAAMPAWAEVAAVDGAGLRVSLPHPAMRIVTLAPHATELVYAAGAGAAMAATVDYSDYPSAARALPRVGGLSGVSLEAVWRLRPDLVVAWPDGAASRDIDRLRQHGVAVFISHPVQLDDVAREILALGRLTGHEAEAGRAAAAYRQRLAGLEQRYAGRAPLRVFFQVSPAPLFTVSDKSFVGTLIHLCGGRNVFGGLPMPAPQVGTEAVLEASPQVILSGDAAALSIWDRYPRLPAVAGKTRFVVPADVTSRPGPRLVEGAAAVCTALDTARVRLGLTPR
ncbi:cobalamin-binding protein [Paludibacterium yongneupense]|uniref:cobalamin-binding protein n=1 Tax=Paludibacterium yongneupense TaxID=400061 RepID=UPI00041D1568|nr:cobalamin-binding protein [Paludibacterium yongneupense]